MAAASHGPRQMPAAGQPGGGAGAGPQAATGGGTPCIVPPARGLVERPLLDTAILRWGPQATAARRPAAGRKGADSGSRACTGSGSTALAGDLVPARRSCAELLGLPALERCPERRRESEWLARARRVALLGPPLESYRGCRIDEAMLMALQASRSLAPLQICGADEASLDAQRGRPKPDAQYAGSDSATCPRRSQMMPPHEAERDEDVIAAGNSCFARVAEPVPAVEVWALSSSPRMLRIRSERPVASGVDPGSAIFLCPGAVPDVLAPQAAANSSPKEDACEYISTRDMALALMIDL